MGRRPACTRASHSSNRSLSARGPTSVPRRTSSFSVKVRAKAFGSVSTTSCTCLRSITITTSARAIISGVTIRLW
jgi:hypothetical protein